MMKKILTLFVSVMVVISALSTAYAAGFKDVTSAYSWAQEAIDTLANEKIIEGYPDGTFMPGKDITKQEAITLFSRCLGSSDKTNEDIVTIAYNNAEQTLAKYNSYALNQAAYLMYKKVITEDDLVTYLSASNKDKPLKRYEAATLIAKCLGGEVWLKSNPDVKADFADSDDIPAIAQGYVYYASELGIIKGMDGNKFTPNGNVTRAQIATMIHRILEMMKYSYSKWVVTSVDADLNIVTLRNEDGESEKYTIGTGVPVMINGEKSQLTLLSGGMEVVLTFAHDSDTGADRLYSVDAVSVVTEDSIDGIYRGRKTENSGTKITVADLEDRTKSAQYTLSTSVAVKYEGASSTLADFKDGDFIHLEISSGKVAVIEGSPKTTTVENAVVESIPADVSEHMSVRTVDNEVLEFDLAPGASLRRNGAVAEFRDLAVGDSIDLTLEYGKIKSAVAVGGSKDVSGIIDSIYHSSTESLIGVKKGETVTEYTVSRDAVITMNGENVTLYDLRVGYSVEIVASSLTVKEINVTSSTTAAQRSVTGVITAVNTEWGMIQVSAELNNGDITPQQVFLKKNATILDSSNGKKLSMNDLKVGMNILAAGSESGGIFETYSVMVIPEEK